MLFFKNFDPLDDGYEPTKEGVMEMFEDDPYSWTTLIEAFCESLESGEVEEHEWVRSA